MLVNMMGIEDGELDANPTVGDGVVDPKSRDTLTTLFGAMLTSFVSSGKPPGRAKAPVRTIGDRADAAAPVAAPRLNQDAA